MRRICCRVRKTLKGRDGCREGLQIGLVEIFELRCRVIGNYKKIHAGESV
jgi:hypothetical protein